MAKQAHIKVFDSLRGLMALWVAVVHTLMTLDIFVPKVLSKVLNVAYAVDVFIILSGFVIFMLLDAQRENYKSFIVRRAFRLFPVYLIALFVSALTIKYQLEIWQSIGSEGHYWQGRLNTLTDSFQHFWVNLLLHIPLLQGLFGNVVPSSDFTFIEPAWSLSLEWQFYLIAPLLFVAVKQSRQGLLLFFALIFTMSYGLLGSGFLPNQFHLFTIGIASYYVYKNADKKTNILPFLIFCIGILLRDVPISIWGLFFSIGFYQYKWSNFLRKIFEFKFLLHLGMISYPFYVIHTLLVFPIIIICEELNLANNNQKLFIILGTLILTFVIAHLLHFWVERPAMEYGKKLAKKIQKNDIV